MYVCALSSAKHSVIWTSNTVPHYFGIQKQRYEVIIIPVCVTGKAGQEHCRTLVDSW